jgi:hypothetical protein
MKTAGVPRLPLAVIALATAASIAIWVLAAAPAGASAGFDPKLTPSEQAAEKVETAEAAPYTASASPKRATKVVKPKSTSKRTTSNSRPATVTAKSTKTTAKPRTSATKTKSPGTGTKSTATKSGSDLSRAQSLLKSYTRKYPILKGSTVTIGDARGHQAICYYQSGRIVISPKRKASLEAIVAHEIWHIIDWRDNGRIDWGESVPPKNASSYVGR